MIKKDVFASANSWLAHIIHQARPCWPLSKRNIINFKIGKKRGVCIFFCIFGANTLLLQKKFVILQNYICELNCSFI